MHLQGSSAGYDKLLASQPLGLNTGAREVWGRCTMESDTASPPDKFSQSMGWSLCYSEFRARVGIFRRLSGQTAHMDKGSYACTMGKIRRVASLGSDTVFG